MEMTSITPDVPVAAPQAKAEAGDVLMTRSPKDGGKGVTKMQVPAAEIENYLKAGWHRA